MSSRRRPQQRYFCLINLSTGKQSGRYQGRSPKLVASRLFSITAFKYSRNQQPLPIPFQITIKEINNSRKIFRYEYNTILHEEYIQNELRKEELRLRRSFARKIKNRTNLITSKTISIDQIKNNSTPIRINKEEFEKTQISGLIIETHSNIIGDDDNYIIEI